MAVVCRGREAVGAEEGGGQHHSSNKPALPSAPAHGNKHPIKPRPSHITVIKAPALAFMGFLIMSIRLPGLSQQQFMMSPIS